MIAFLGTGLLGSGFVRAMISKGAQVQVWNRTAEKARALEAYGAKAHDNITDAVTGADTIHMTLKDDEAVDEVLAMASAGFKPGVTIIDHTTTSAEGAVKRTKEWKERGYTYLHAPVFMGPQNSLESTGFMMVSGDQELIERLMPELSKLTGKVLNFGTESGKAAGIKLIGNLFLAAVTGGLADGMALAKAQGVSIADVVTLFDSWNPGTSVPARLKKMTGNTFHQPSWELNMARKDVRLMMEGAKKGNTRLFVIPAIAEEMDRWIAKGHGSDDWTVIGKDAVS